MSVLKTDDLLLGAVRRAKCLAGRSLYLPSEAPHFQVQVNGQWYVFCAIHKNASSSIRSLIEVGSTKNRGNGESIFDFLFRNHLVRKHSELERASQVMVFVRDPLHRVASCFQNKFIQRKGNCTIFRDYECVTGRDPVDATFESFVRDYVAASFKGEVVDRRRDRHIYTQQQQLLPVNYDVVASVDQFDETMTSLGLAHLLVGRSNATANTVEIAGAWGKTAEVLHNDYRAHGQTPSRNSLLSEPLIAEIKFLYRADAGAFDHLLGDKSL